MGKSHIGLTYSQEINEILDKLANMVSALPLTRHPTCVVLSRLSLLTCCLWPRTAASCPSGPAEAATSRSRRLSSTPAPTPPETSSSWRHVRVFTPHSQIKVRRTHSLPSALAGVRRLHRPAQQHRHRVRALVVREAYQHDLLPQDQGAVSVAAQRPGDAAQQVLHQEGGRGLAFLALAGSSIVGRRGHNLCSLCLQCRELYYCVKDSMERAAARQQSIKPGRVFFSFSSFCFPPLPCFHCFSSALFCQMLETPLGV